LKKLTGQQVLDRKEITMLNERIEAVRPIAEKLSAVEVSLNQSITLLGELIASIPAARTTLGTRIPISTGMEACENLALAVSSTARGYREVIQAHGHFAQDRDDLGLRTVNWGDILECPPEHGRQMSEPHLQIVRAA
jgi:hypothetical protein